MKIILNPSVLSAIKDAAGNVRSSAITAEETTCYIEARQDNTVYTFVKANLGVSYERVMEAEVKEPGAIAVPGKILHDVIGRFTAPELSVVRDGKFLRIKEKGSRIDLPIYGVDIPYPEKPVNANIRIPAQVLLAAITDTKFAVVPAAKRVEGLNSKVMLSTLHIVNTGDVVSFEGCNGFIGGKLSCPIQNTGSVDIPQELLAIIAPVLKNADAETDAVISFDKNRISISCDGVTVTCQRFVGKYLDTDAVYAAADYKTEVVFDVDELKELVARALAITIQGRRDAIRLIFPAAVEDATTTPIVKVEYTTLMGEVEGEFPCSVVRAAEAETTIAFNPEYLQRAVQGLNGDTTFLVNEAARAMVVRGSLTKGEHTLTQERIILPVRA